LDALETGFYTLLRPFAQEALSFFNSLVIRGCNGGAANRFEYQTPKRIVRVHARKQASFGAVSILEKLLNPEEGNGSFLARQKLMKLKEKTHFADSII
jgi:hypothetical protein